MKYLNRNKLYEKQAPNKNAKKLYVFCEGQVKGAEVEYFKYFEGLSSNINIIPIPNVNGKSDPLSLKEHADFLFNGNEEISAEYELNEYYKDEVWFVIDTDRWNEGDKIQRLKEFCEQENDKIKNKYTCWQVAQSNPCFEVWFYYHFYSVKPNTDEVSASKSFKQFVNNAIKGGFNPKSMPIEMETAITNSLQNFSIENNQPTLYSTEVHNLGQVIIPFVKDQLEKARLMGNMNRE